MLRRFILLTALLLTPALAQRTIPFATPEGLPDGVYVVTRAIDGDTFAVAQGGVVRSVRLLG